MPVCMVRVRHVRVHMLHRRMVVPVAVRGGRRRTQRRVVGMVVVAVVMAVRVFVFVGVVAVRMAVRLGQVQQHAGQHHP